MSSLQLSYSLYRSCTLSALLSHNTHLCIMRCTTAMSRLFHNTTMSQLFHTTTMSLHTPVSPSPHKINSPLPNPPAHAPVFGSQILDSLQPRESGDVYLDMTFGAGGHTRLLLGRDPSARVIAVDCDIETVQAAQALREEFPGRLCYLNMKLR